MLPIQGIKMFRPFMKFQKSAVNMTMSNVPTNGISWIMNVKHMGGSSNSHSPVLILIQ